MGRERGFDAGKKVKGRKRHILTDTGGLLVAALVHGASIQDRDGAPAVLASIRYAFPWLRHIFADGAYGGPKLEDALRRLGRWTLEIVKRSDACRSSPWLTPSHGRRPTTLNNNGSPAWASECPFLGAKQTWISGDWRSACSHKQTHKECVNAVAGLF